MSSTFPPDNSVAEEHLPENASAVDIYNALIQGTWRGYYILATDGSRHEQPPAVGAAMVDVNKHPEVAVINKLSPTATVYDAEVRALQLAVDYINGLDRDNILILTDSKRWRAANPEGEKENEAAKCTVCDVALSAHQADLKKHATKPRHLSMLDIWKRQKQSRLDNLGIEIAGSDKKTIDLRLAVYTACHSAIRSVDHLCDILKEIGKGSKLENLQLRRTKCTKLMLADVGDSAFSLIIDESTDVSAVKFLALIIRYFSKTEEKVITEFPGFIEVYSATAVALFESIKNYLQSIELNYKNLIGLGKDGASNLCGRNHPVYTMFKAEIPETILV
ncbi:hypothetical protein FOCC_FOCC006192, partial [Frankliniella occidentalis]